MSERYDAIVIGTGQAGPSLAVRLAKAGRKTAIIERKRFGGTCVNNGCIPTKTLIASARAAHVDATGGRLGRRRATRGCASTCAAVKARKDAVVKASSEGVIKLAQGHAGVTVIEGHARFEGPHTVRVGDLQLEAPQIFVNVGGRAAVPPIDRPRPGRLSRQRHDDGGRLRCPRHLVVVGGSYVGLEFAQMYRRFGAQVTVVEMAPRLIAREDADVSAAVKEILEAEGITIRLGREVRCRAAATAIGIAVAIDCDDEPKEVVGTHLLLATGRRPNTDDLGCERAGHRARRARLHRRRRRAADERRRHLRARRRQRPRRVHAYRVQRLRDRRREPARRRIAAGQRPHSDLRALHRSAAGPRRHDRARGAREREARRSSRRCR